MLPAVRQHSHSLAALLSEKRVLQELRNQRRRAEQEGNVALIAELSVEILNRVEQRAAAIAADVKLQTNEQIKYSSTFVNTMAAGIFTAGVGTPVMGISRTPFVRLPPASAKGQPSRAARRFRPKRPELVWGFWCQAFFVVVRLHVFYPFQVSLFGWRAVSLPRPASRK